MAQYEVFTAMCLPPGLPVRTCVGCRARTLSSDLLRLVAVANAHSGKSVSPGFTLTPDPARRLPGRGAWLHPNAECLRLAERRRAFGRALRVPGDLDLGVLQSSDVLAGLDAVESPSVCEAESTTDSDTA